MAEISHRGREIHRFSVPAFNGLGLEFDDLFDDFGDHGASLPDVACVFELACLRSQGDAGPIRILHSDSKTRQYEKWLAQAWRGSVFGD